MVSHQAKFIIAMGLVAAFLAACATYPISETYREQANPQLPFKVILQDPGRYVGMTVIWGGQILETVNTPEGSELTVLETPLDEDQAPVSPSASEGRFMAKTPEFLDPALFKAGRFITLAGEITGSETKALGSATYAYPLIRIKQTYLWRTEGSYPPYYYRGYPPSYYWPYDNVWYWGWYPFWVPFGVEVGHFDHFEHHGHGGGHFERGGHMHGR